MNKKVIFLFLLLVENCYAISDHINDYIDKILVSYNIPSKSLSLYIKNLDSDELLLTLNIDEPRNPASVIKVLTTYAGLELLGQNYKWQTKFYISGNIKEETLHGDLIIKGGGDPFLTKENFLYSLLTLQAKGIKHINGNLLIDNSLFEIESGYPGDFDNRPYRIYNVFPNATLLNFNAHEFNFIPKINNVTIYADPPASNMVIENKLRFLKSRKCTRNNNLINMNVDYEKEKTIVKFSGTYLINCSAYKISRSVMPNDQYIYGVFKSLWENMGGTITGNFGERDTSQAKLFHTIDSYPLGEIVTYINKYSNNVMAKQLLLTIAAETENTAGRNAIGRRVIKNWLMGLGISTDNLFIENGSGLSRNTRISARTLGQLLEYAYRNSLQSEFLSSLSLNGVNGTAKKRLKGIVPKGMVRIKTGSINDVKSMAGYVHSKSGQRYIVVSLHNYPGIQNGLGNRIQDKVLQWIYEK